MNARYRQFLGRYGLFLVSILLAISCICLAVVAYRYDWWDNNQVALNLFVALVSIIFTIVVIDRLIVLRSKEQIINRLLLQLRCGDRALASWAFRELVDEGYLEDGSLRGANLSDAYFEEANLSHVDLQGANLENANLRRAILEESNLAETRLVGADMTGANMIKANVYHTRFWATEDRSAGFLLKSFFYEWHAALEEKNKAENIKLISTVFDKNTTLPDGSKWIENGDLDTHTGKNLWISLIRGRIHRYVNILYQIDGPQGKHIFETKKLSDIYIRKTYTKK